MTNPNHAAADGPHTAVPGRRRHSLAVAVSVLVVALLAWPAEASNDPSYAKQWALPKIGAPAAWAATTGDGVRIGIVDTGIDLGHEDLAGAVVAHTSCIGSGGDPSRCGGSGQDENGHGTHVAGIVAAAKDNGVGVAGVAPDAELVVAKALDGKGSGTTEDINGGIRWVVDNGARVVNLSLGGNFLITSLFGTSFAEGVEYAWSKGAVVVLASGNTNLLGLGIGSSDYGELPAIVVGATGPDDRVASYSSPMGNARWSIVAPGGAGKGTEGSDVLSTYWRPGKANQYAALAGTSMATPHVAAAAAMVLSRGATPEAAVARILATADRRVACGSGSPNCKGRLDVAAAVADTPATGGGGPAPSPGLADSLLGLDLGGLRLLV
ncbi:MAG: S8 family serine peptidase [Actinobacteria bacterium]|nr:S8 family serine peptidase [Actinomycetota bacterium]